MDAILHSGVWAPGTESESDEALAARALHEPEAFTALYRTYAFDVYRYCYRRLENREAAEDATSQTFTNAYAGLKRLGHKPFRPWLFAIAHNVVVDAYRNRRATASLDDLYQQHDPGDSPESVAIGAESRGAVRMLLEQLPKRDREVVELRLAGLSGLEIAQTLGCSHAAVRVAHHRALERMRALMDASGNENGDRSRGVRHG